MLARENSEHVCETGEQEKVKLFNRRCKKCTEKRKKGWDRLLTGIFNPETGFI